MSIGLADARVLRNDVSECDVYEIGMLCVDAPTNHIGYVNEEFNIENKVNGDWKKVAELCHREKLMAAGYHI